MTSPKIPVPPTKNRLGKTSTPDFSVQAYQGITIVSRAAEIWRALLCLGSPTRESFATHVGMLLCFSVLGWRGGIEEKRGRGVGV